MSPPAQRSGAPPPRERPAPESSSRHHAAEYPEATATGRLDDAELLAEAHRLTNLVLPGVRQRFGRIPVIGTPAWWTASDAMKTGTLLVLSEAWLIHDPERMVRRRLREMAWDLSQATDWSAASRRPSHASLAARRTEPGPMVRSFDAAAAARWVATGSSEGR